MCNRRLHVRASLVVANMFALAGLSLALACPGCYKGNDDKDSSDDANGRPSTTLA